MAQIGPPGFRNYPEKSSGLSRTASLNYETALLECAAGGRSGVAAIYSAERAQLCTVARRIVRTRDRAEDVIHEAFIQILRDAKTFDPARGSARAWIYTIVRNKALKSLQKSKREIPVGAEELQQLADLVEMAKDLSAILAENASLRACLEELDPKRRATLIMAIIDGRTHAEIAAYLRVPVGTIKAWIRRELIALRKRLG